MCEIYYSVIELVLNSLNISTLGLKWNSEWVKKRGRGRTDFYR